MLSPVPRRCLVAELRDPSGARRRCRSHIPGGRCRRRRGECAACERALLSSAALDCDERPPKPPHAAAGVFPASASEPVVVGADGSERLRIARGRSTRRRRRRLRASSHAGYLRTDAASQAACSELPWWARLVRDVDIVARSHSRLIDALEAWCDRRPAIADRIEAVFAGKVTEEDRALVARSRVAQLVRFTGYVPHHESVALVRRAQLLFLPMHDLPPGERSRIVTREDLRVHGIGAPDTRRCSRRGRAGLPRGMRDRAGRPSERRPRDGSGARPRIRFLGGARAGRRNRRGLPGAIRPSATLPAPSQTRFEEPLPRLRPSRAPETRRPTSRASRKRGPADVRYRGTRMVWRTADRGTTGGRSDDPITTPSRPGLRRPQQHSLCGNRVQATLDHRSCYRRAACRERGRHNRVLPQRRDLQLPGTARRSGDAESCVFGPRPTPRCSRTCTRSWGSVCSRGSEACSSFASSTTAGGRYSSRATTSE